ncbi:helix-turn-helix domain-containing protein [Lysinibacillus sp. BSL11]
MINLRLKVARKAKKLTQEQLANKLQTTKGTISNYENGYSTPSNEMLVLLSEVLDVSTDYLLGKSTSLLDINNKFIAPVDEAKAILTTREAENKILPDEKKLLDDIRSSESRDEIVEIEVLQRVNTFLTNEKDIAKRLQNFKDEIENSDGLSFDGEPMSDEARESLIESMDHVFRQTQRINKKYTPKKFREDE